MKTVVSGIRPTGNIHLGNYFGAIVNFVKMQNDYKSYFFIADYHSLTTHPTPEDLNSNVKKVLVNYLASGIDPQKAIIYRQSDVPETAELYLFLNMIAYMGELQKVASFKEKVRSNPNNVNAGLLTYPTLMAADIIIHKAHMVPVGKDQEQHLEMTRDYVSRFNHIYKTDYFPEPVAFNFSQDLVKVPGLDGSTKMSKSSSENNCIYLSDEPSVIKKKIMRAVSDSGPTEPNQPKAVPIQNLFQLMSIVSSDEIIEYFEDQYNNCNIRYGDMKKQIAEDMITFCAPFRERILELENDNEYLQKVLKEGAEQARESASQTLKEVREIIGFRAF